MTMSASAGRHPVVRCPSRNSLGSLCQKELLDAGVGSVARVCFMLRLLGELEADGCGVEGKAANGAFYHSAPYVCKSCNETLQWQSIVIRPFT